MSDTFDAIFASPIYVDLLKLQKSTTLRGSAALSLSLSLFDKAADFHFSDVPAGGIYFDATTLSTNDAGAFDDAKLNPRCSQ